MSLIECVPNFSDGRDARVAESLRRAILSVKGVQLLGWHSDPDHNRSVATFAGPPEVVLESARRAVTCAVSCIDLTRHRGVHPRLGATDVCPFVPLDPSTMEGCVTLAHRLGDLLGSELDLPVYYYGEAALNPGRRGLPDVRRGGFEALRDSLGRDAARKPDAGPERVHPTAGAVAVGARPFLVAFNVNLETSSLELARSIAGELRESSGGLPGVRALGFLLASRGCSQVSMNLCSPERTGLADVFERVERLARAAGVAVRETELVGLAPRTALDADIARRVRLPFDAARCVVEDALAMVRASEGSRWPELP
jgi:glutamate formiminotransferase